MIIRYLIIKNHIYLTMIEEDKMIPLKLLENNDVITGMLSFIFDNYSI